MKGRKRRKQTPRRYHRPHGNQTIKTYERQKTKELDIAGIRMIAIYEGNGRNVPAHAQLRNLRKRNNTD